MSKKKNRLAAEAGFHTLCQGLPEWGRNKNVRRKKSRKKNVGSKRKGRDKMKA